MDNHEILGLGKDASKDEVKDAYRKLVVKYHPDLNHEPGAAEKFLEVNKAYLEILESLGEGKDVSFATILRGQIRGVKTNEQKAKLYVAVKLAQLVQMFSSLTEVESEMLISGQFTGGSRSGQKERLMEAFFETDDPMQTERYKEIAYFQFNDWRDFLVGALTECESPDQMQEFCETANQWLAFAVRKTNDVPQLDDSTIGLVMKHLAKSVREVNEEIFRPKELC